jgi:hypothetical protein
MNKFLYIILYGVSSAIFILSHIVLIKEVKAKKVNAKVTQSGKTKKVDKSTTAYLNKDNQ